MKLGISPNAVLTGKEKTMNGIETGSLTPRAVQVLSSAHKEATRLKHNFIGTEHLLLGLIRLQEGVAFKVLQKMGLNLETIRLEVEGQVSVGPDQKVIGVTPFTPRSKKVLALAEQQAKELNHRYVGSEHILLGLLKEDEGVAARVLKKNVISIDRTIEEVLKELDPSYNPEKPTQGELDQSEGSDKIDVATIKRLGDQFVSKMVATVAGSARKNQAFSEEEQVPMFFCLKLLLAGGYTFSSMKLEVVLALNACATTTKRLDIICNIIRRRWSGDKYTSIIASIQELYDYANTESAAETLLGSLLQKLIGEFPRKIGPARNMLLIRDFVTNEMSGDTYLDDPAPTPETPPPAPPTT